MAKLKIFKKYLPVYLMMLPGIIYLIVNNYIPMTGLITAFQRFNVRGGIYNSPWVGLDNFKYLFVTRDAAIITRNTLLYNMAFICVNTILGIMIAIFICEIKNKFAKKIYQSAILLPYLVSIIIVSYMVFGVLSVQTGMMNKSILPALGKEAVSWYSEPAYWPMILILVNTWKGVGFGCLIYLSGVNGIDRSLYEAAEIDGAGKLRQIFSITLPGIKPQIITMILLAVGRIFYSDFGLFFQIPMDSGLLYDVTNTIDTYVYRSLMKASNIGMSAAAGFYQSLVGFVLVLTANLVVRKFSPENAMF